MMMALFAMLCVSQAIPSRAIVTTPVRLVHKDAKAFAAPAAAQALILRGGGEKTEKTNAAPPRSALPFLLRVVSMLSIYASLCWLEHVLASQVLARSLPGLLAPSPLLGGAVSTAYGGVIIINVVASSFMMLYLSFIRRRT